MNPFVTLSPKDRAILKNFTFDEASNFSGCYALDAAHDFDTCRPCTGNVHEDDMAGMGHNCTRVMRNAAGCYECKNYFLEFIFKLEESITVATDTLRVQAVK